MYNCKTLVSKKPWIYFAVFGFDNGNNKIWLPTNYCATHMSGHSDAHWPWYALSLCATLHLPLGPSLMKSSSFSAFARLLISPSDTHQRLFHHTNSAGWAQIANKHGPATGPHKWRWPNKPRPHIMRSDSPMLRERPGLSPRPFVLAFLQFSEWLSPLDTTWQLAGKIWVYDDLVGTASCSFCPCVAITMDRYIHARAEAIESHSVCYMRLCFPGVNVQARL